MVYEEGDGSVSGSLLSTVLSSGRTVWQKSKKRKQMDEIDRQLFLALRQTIIISNSGKFDNQ